MFDDHHRAAVVAQRPQIRDIVEHQHVAVHENGPSGEIGKPGGQEAGEGKIRRLQRVPLAAEHPLQLRQHQRCDAHRLRGAPVDAVGEDIEGGRFTAVISDADIDHGCLVLEIQRQCVALQA
jgi:hypothetical protein